MTNSKNTILDHLAALLQEKGESEVTMDDLAERSGLSRATLYRRYGSRTALLTQLAAERGFDVAELDQPDVRTRILQAARQVFGNLGLSAATVADIAAAADVGPATIYRHFGSREELVKAFVQWSRPVAAIQDLQRESDLSLTTTLTHFAESALKSMLAEGPLLRLLLTRDPEGLAWLNDLRAGPERTQAMLTAYMQSQIDAGRLRPADPEKLALAFIGMLFVFGVVNPFYDGQPEKDLDIPATAAFVTQLFLNGAQAPPEANA